MGTLVWPSGDGGPLLTEPPPVRSREKQSSKSAALQREEGGGRECLRSPPAPQLTPTSGCSCWQALLPHTRVEDLGVG